jgi:hypothetical protein
MCVRPSPQGKARSNAYWGLLPLVSDTLFMVPFAKDDLFVGREDIIVKISERRAAMLTHKRMALIGLGGVGYVLFARACCAQLR